MKQIIIVLAILLPCGVLASGLELEKLNSCELTYAGESCVVDMNLISNEANCIEATMIINYSGQCGDSYDGIGIVSKLNNKVLDTQLDISSGLNKLQLDIETATGLCPGEYSFELQLGYEKEVVASISSGGFYLEEEEILKSPQVVETSEMSKKELLEKMIEIIQKLISLYQQMIELIELQ